MDVNDLMAEERYREIAEYCVRDVVATTRLFHIWKERLEGARGFSLAPKTDFR